MARKGNQQKNGMEGSASNHKKGGLQSGSAMPNKKGKGSVGNTKVVKEEIPSDTQPNISVAEALQKSDHVKDEKKRIHKSGKHNKVDAQGTAGTSAAEQSEPRDGTSDNCSANMSTTGSFSLEEEKWASANGIPGSKNRKRSSGRSMNGFDRDGLRKSVELPETLKTFLSSVSQASTEWFDRHKPLLDILVTKTLISRDYVRMKIKYAYPIVLRWLTPFINILLVLFMVWLDCTLRGIDTIVRLGTTSFFTVIWCSIFSVVAMMGMLKFITVGVST